MDLDTGVEAPSGVLVGAEGSRYPFTGWIGLAAAIEAWRASAGERPMPPRPASGPLAVPETPHGSTPTRP